MRLRATAEFDEWTKGLSAILLAMVKDRLERILHDDHFGDSRSLGDGLFELRWKKGTRVYFGYMTDEHGNLVLMLLGGDKNGQNRDIRKARTLLARETA